MTTELRHNGLATSASSIKTVLLCHLLSLFTSRPKNPTLRIQHQIYIQYLTTSSGSRCFCFDCLKSPTLRMAISFIQSGWSGGAIVLGKLPVPGRPTVWMIVGQGPIALAVGAGGGCLDIFTLLYPFSTHSPSLWETVRYRLKYCLKWAVKP